MFTAIEIATLAFQEFIRSGSSNLAKHFTQGAINKMKDLRNLIWDKLSGNHDAENAFNNIVENNSEDDVADVATYLKLAMRKDPEFAEEIQLVAKEINAGKILDQSSMNQSIYGNARGWQTKVEGGRVQIGEFHQNYTSDDKIFDE